jgi:enamine deaminase RidA (YjgF/YER057c/UK114 family)
MTSPEARLAELGVELPAAPAPAAAYVPTVRTGALLYTAGQLPLSGGSLVTTGLCGAEVTTQVAQRCARQCAVNVVAQLKAAAGDLSRVQRIVKVTVFVASTPQFQEQHLVANGASEFFGEVFGELGRHARSAIGVASLPMNAPVEVEAVVELRS